MPTMDGLEFTRRLAADPSLGRVPVIFYTATYRLGEARSLAAECGVATVIGKPADPQEVLDVVHGALGLAAQVVAPEGIAALTGRHRALAVDRLCATAVVELGAWQAQIRDAIEGDDTPSGKARKLEELSTELDSSLARAQALAMRLSALVELGLDLATQSDRRALLEMFCHAGRDIMNARIAAVCVLQEGGGLLDYVGWGMSDEQVTQIRGALAPTEGFLGEVMRDNRSFARSGLRGRHTSLGFPACHPAIDTLLVVPVKSGSRTYGWFYVADKVGGGDFADDDVQFAETLAAELAPEYESRVLYDQLSRHAALLEVEADQRKKALEELRESETRFRQLAENIREVLFLLEVPSGAMLYVSPAYEEIWQRSCESLYESPESWLDAVHPEDHAMALRTFAKGRMSGEFKFKYRIRRADGIRWIKAKSFPILDSSGKPFRMAGLAEDITESELQERKIERLSRIHAVLSGINSAIVRIRERSALLDEACRIVTEHGRFPLVWIGLVQPDTARIEFVAYNGVDRAAADALAGVLVDDAVSKRGPAAQALRSRAHVVYNDIQSEPNGSRVLSFALERGYHSMIALPLMPDARPSGVVILFAHESDFFDAEELKLLDELAGDISFALEYIARDERLHYLAYYDPLTDLPNTALFHTRLEAAIERSPSQTALFLIDLDRFTDLNDSLGRHVGDQLLVAVGKRLRTTLAENAHLARVGSDTFAVAVHGLRDDTKVGAILQERIFGALSSAFPTDGGELRVTARVGIAVAPTDGGDPATLFKNAEAALKEAKTSGARYRFYSSELNERVAEDLALEQQLLSALQRQEFVVHYQPKIDAKSNELVGLEALLRWNSPDRGLVPPARFIPALEASELILDVGRWVIEKALSDHQAWQQRGLKPPRIAVNVSALQLRYADFPDMVLKAIDERSVESSALELEITESVIMADIQSSIERLEKISERGVTIAIDDFGTGYSSLRYLAKLPVHALKIDRSFVVAMTTDADTMTLVSTIIGLAHAFDMLVVAEGVDSEEQAKLLRLLKCDMMQGYLFGRPQPAEEIEALLAARE
jgi:diguanylate cyclase (GGDEF)-like protein/PAS domain S-box-containing protein